MRSLCVSRSIRGWVANLRGVPRPKPSSTFFLSGTSFSSRPANRQQRSSSTISSAPDGAKSFRVTVASCVVRFRSVTRAHVARYCLRPRGHESSSRFWRNSIASSLDRAGPTSHRCLLASRSVARSSGRVRRRSSSSIHLSPSERSRRRGPCERVGRRVAGMPSQMAVRLSTTVTGRSRVLHRSGSTASAQGATMTSS
jgi:hypothetical protein